MFTRPRRAGFRAVATPSRRRFQNSSLAILRWDASSGATSYTVKWGTSTGTYTSNQSVGNVTSYDPTSLGLTQGVTYFMAVFASNGSGESSASNEIQVLNGRQVGP